MHARGETVTTASRPADEALDGYHDPNPMVFCGLFPIDGDELPDLRDALEKLRLNDASFTYEPESSRALGFGFRCGFLGLLHMEIVRERLEREFDLSLIATAPSVAYQAYLNDGTMVDVDNPSELPEPTHLDHVDEPMLKATILTPAEYTGTIMDLCQGRRAEMLKMEYLSPERVEFVYSIPLGEVVVNFFDHLKSRTKGYASLDYEPAGYATSDLVKVDVLINHNPGGRLLYHRPPVTGRLLRAPDDREAPGADPTPDVRRSHPGRHRRQGALPGETVKARRKDVPRQVLRGVTSPGNASFWRSRRKARRR